MIKITAADKWFSNCVRQRAAWRCERCGSFFPEGEGRKGLHCSHYHGRGNWSVRHDPDNAEALCMGCHLRMGAYPTEHGARILEKLGPYRLQALQERSQDTLRGRRARKEAKAVATHYRSEFERIRNLEGATARIEFTGYF